MNRPTARQPQPKQIKKWARPAATGRHPVVKPRFDKNLATNNSIPQRPPVARVLDALCAGQSFTAGGRAYQVTGVERQGPAKVITFVPAVRRKVTKAAASVVQQTAAAFLKAFACAVVIFGLLFLTLTAL